MNSLDVIYQEQDERLAEAHAFLQGPDATEQAEPAPLPTGRPPLRSA